MTRTSPKSKYALDILTLRDWYGDSWKHIGQETELANWIPELLQALIAHVSWKLGPRANIGPAEKIRNITPRVKTEEGTTHPGYTWYILDQIATAQWKLGTPWLNETATEAFKRIIALCNYALVLEGLEEWADSTEKLYKIRREERRKTA